VRQRLPALCSSKIHRILKRAVLFTVTKEEEEEEEEESLFRADAVN